MEMRPTSKKSWTKVDDTKSLELTASNLSEGTEYVFRVAAQNAVGVGEFVELQKAVIPKGQFGEYIYILCLCIQLCRIHCFMLKGSTKLGISHTLWHYRMYAYEHYICCYLNTMVKVIFYLDFRCERLSL